jgi:seryl-tRNA synthetase
MQLFRMREYVCVGTPERVQAFREDWLARGPDLVETLGLPHHLDAANDPFFGRAGKMVASSQRDQGLKVELLIPVNDGASPTACLSFNYHLDHFGSTWGLRTPDGEVAHTACVGFGLERLTLALLRHHGSDLGGWPPAVRTALSLT